MQMTIKSKKLGCPIVFSRPGRGYIFVNLNGGSGTLGTQICQGGTTMGSTISYDGCDPMRFEAICRRWYRAAMRNGVLI